MTNKEASEILKTEWDINAEIFDTNFHEALALAIKALKFQDHVKKACSANCGYVLESYIREILKEAENDT